MQIEQAPMSGASVRLELTLQPESPTLRYTAPHSAGAR